jgi:hypothetical protein
MRPGSGLAIAALAVLAACSPKIPTVPGPETPALLARLHGHLVWGMPRGGIAGMSFPGAVQSVVRAAAAGDATEFATVHSLSGPDEEGRLAYVEDHFFTADEKDRKHVLKTIRIDGTSDTVVFERPGSPLAGAAGGKGRIGRYLALSRTGGQVAFVKELEGQQMPDALLQVGALEVVDLATGASKVITDHVVDQPLAWLPDGRRLLYVSLVAKAALPSGAVGLLGPGTLELAWEQVPAVHVLDVETGTSSYLCVGSRPIAAADGQSAWIGAWQSRAQLTWMHVGMDGKNAKLVTIPGDANGLVAATAEGLVVDWAWPTAGAPSGMAGESTPLLSIKGIDPDTQQFVTLVPQVDPRSSISYGAIR